MCPDPRRRHLLDGPYWKLSNFLRCFVSKIAANWVNCLVFPSEVDMDDSGSPFPFVFNNCISVKAAAQHSGYSAQFLHRSLRDGKLGGRKLGQTWLIDKRTLEAYLEKANHTQDKRFGPK